MNYQLDLNVPKTLRGVKLREWIKFFDIYEKNKDNESNDFLNKKIFDHKT